MLAGFYDPGFEESRLRPLVGHSLAVYEPDPALSMVWPLPDQDEADEYHRRAGRRDSLPEWAEQDDFDWKSARPSWVVVLLGGAPIWQQLVWYLDWGSGIGGYVPDFQAILKDGESHRPELVGWETTTWATGLARLINSFSATGDFGTFDPTPRLVPQPSGLHPVDAARTDY